MPVTFIRASQGAHDSIDPPVPELALVLGLKADIPFRWNPGDGWTRQQINHTGDISLCPAYTEVAYECGQDHEVLAAAFPASGVQNILEEHGNYALSIFDSLHNNAIFRNASV